MRRGPLIVTAELVPGRGPVADRVRRRAELLARRGGGTLLAPCAPAGPLIIPGLRHRIAEVSPGASRERRQEAVGEALSALLHAGAPILIHCLGLRCAVPALLRRAARSWVVVEPGVLPSQRTRDAHPELPAAQLAELVALEDRALSRAAAVVAHSAVEAASLIARGVEADRVWTCFDTPPAFTPSAAEPDLPRIACLTEGEPWSGVGTLLGALARLRRPWRAIILLAEGAPSGPVERRVAGLGLGARVAVDRVDGRTLEQLAGCQVVVSALEEGRATRAGGVVPWAGLHGLAAQRAVVASDLPIARAYLGGGAQYFAPGASGALAEVLDGVLGDAGLRASLRGAGVERARALVGSDPDVRIGDCWDTLQEASRP